MKKARSIKQNNYLDALPDFRNLGISLRILLLSNSLALLKAFIDADSGWDVLYRWMQISALLAPVLFTSMLLLWVMQPMLRKMAYRQGVLIVILMITAITLVIYVVGSEVFQPFATQGEYFDMVQYAVISVLVCWVMLMYFRYRAQVLSRALHDARLQVLRARIRPHFLFNTINAVLSIVRAQPKRAETALEDMSDLFRMAMTETHDLVPVAQELALAKQYVALEQLRMGAERLQVIWEVEAACMSEAIPPLLLQPLLENAVYHGIEPLAAGGCIGVAISNHGKGLRLVVENPSNTNSNKSHKGNKMALQNIRERLELLFDAEASYHVEINKDKYRVEITMPSINGGKS